MVVVLGKIRTKPWWWIRHRSSWLSLIHYVRNSSYCGYKLNAKKLLCCRLIHEYDNRDLCRPLQGCKVKYDVITTWQTSALKACSRWMGGANLGTAFTGILKKRSISDLQYNLIQQYIDTVNKYRNTILHLEYRVNLYSKYSNRTVSDCSNRAY